MNVKVKAAESVGTGFLDLAPIKVVQACSDLVVSAKASNAPCMRIVNAYWESILDVAVLYFRDLEKSLAWVD